MKNNKKNQNENIDLAKASTKNYRRLHQMIILLVVAVFYCNTLALDFALDDRMVILESKSTIEGGWQGTRDIFTRDSFSGYFGNDNATVAGGRYRPLSQFTFMVELQLFGHNVKSQIEKNGSLDDYDNLHSGDNEQYFVNSKMPFFSHLFNLLYFALLCLVIYEVLTMLFANLKGEKWFQSLAFLATVLYALHPLHTEAVANIKGRDEIFAMLGGMTALWCSLKFVDQRQWKWLLFSAVALAFGIFSKENAITFLAVVPLSIFFYQKEKKKMDYVWTFLPLLAVAVLFIVVRSKVLGGLVPDSTVDNVLNDPFLASSRVQEIATVLVTWAIYFKLLFFPHPLTHDYYPNQIEITDFSNPAVWVILICCVALVLYALCKLKSRSVVSYGILFFVITFSITSNMLFNVGTFMNERFVFVSSLGFTLICGYWIYLLSISKIENVQKFSLGLLAVVSLLYGVKTFTRNLVWKNDITLFTTDVKVSDNSIKCNISAGGSYIKLWRDDHNERYKKLAYKHLNKALSMDDHSFNAWLLMGELKFYDKDYKGSYEAYHNASLVNPGSQMAQDNMAKVLMVQVGAELDDISALLDAGLAAQDVEKVAEALRRVDQYIAEHPDASRAYNVKGMILGRGFGRMDEAIEMFEKSVQMDPEFVSAYENMGIAYAMKRNFHKAEQAMLKALEIDPGNQNVRDNLNRMYLDSGQPDKAKKFE